MNKIFIAKTFLTAFSISQVAAEHHREVIHPAMSRTVDMSHSSKLVGRIAWNNFFDVWVNYTMPFEVDVDCNPCAFEYQFGLPSQLDARFGLHIAHNCPKVLVDKITFETKLPSFTGSTLVLHSDENTTCEATTASEQVCTSVLTLPKQMSGSQPGNDAGLWIPLPYDQDNLTWEYAYMVDRTKSTQPDGGSESGSGSTSSNDFQPQVPCEEADIKAAIVPAGFIGDENDFVWDCIRFDDAFVFGGSQKTRIEEVSFFFGDTRIYGVEIKVTNGNDSQKNQLQQFDAHQEISESSHRKMTIPWIDDAVDLVIYYNQNSQQIYTVGLAAYNTDFSSFATAGTVTDSSAEKYWPIHEVGPDFEVLEIYNICGWYYAYDKKQGLSAGYAPIVCPTPE